MDVCHQYTGVEARAVSINQLKTNGFTLVELLFVIAIMSILLGLAVANLQPIIERSQSEQALSDLRMDIVFSRGEAIKRGGSVGFCGTQTGDACINGYQSGWLVLLYNNTDTILSWTRQEESSVTIELEEIEQAAGGSIMFNYRGYPDRPFILRTSKGDSVNEFIVQKTGNVEAR